MPFSLRHDSRGQGLSEYIIIAVLVAVLVLLGVRYFGSSVREKFGGATEQVTNLKDDGVSQSPGVSSTGGARPLAGESAGLSSSSVGHNSESIEVKGSGAKRTELLTERDRERIQELKFDTTTLFILGAAVCTGGIFIVMRSKPKKGEKKKRRKWQLFARQKGREQGQAMVEFVLISITFLFTILGVLQLALVLNAYSLVRYAAYNSARAAIVHGGDTTEMREAVRLSLLPIFPRHGRADHIRGVMENYLGARETDSDTSLTYYNEPISETRILNTHNLPPNKVVTFDDPASEDTAVVTVQVVHRYELVIPLVNRIIFWAYQQYRDMGGYEGQSLNYISDRSDRRRREGDYKDIEYRIPIVAHYTMRLQSDWVVPAES